MSSSEVAYNGKKEIEDKTTRNDGDVSNMITETRTPR